MDFTDVVYEARDGTAWITINRPERRNAFRGRTVHELIESFRRAWRDRDVGVVVLTGAGDKAFCSGGDQKERGAEGYEELDEVAALHTVIRNIPKPVIAMVNGFAIGGGHVLHVICDLSIASDTAIFGQTGPRVGSVDPGFGTAYLARVIGEKKAREIWYLCRQYSAAEALAMGLVNKVVPAAELRAETEAWCARASRQEPDRPQAREGIVQRRYRSHPRHRRARFRGGRALLRHQRGERGRARRSTRSARPTSARRSSDGARVRGRSTDRGGRSLVRPRRPGRRRLRPSPGTPPPCRWRRRY